MKKAKTKAKKSAPVRAQVIQTGIIKIPMESEYEIWKELLEKLGISMNLDVSARAADLAAVYKIQRR